MPVGINYKRVDKDAWIYGGALCREFPNDYPETKYGIENGIPDALDILRRTLAEAQDHSITFVVTGSMSSAARLVQSEADEISPLSGKELILQKINKTVVMGGSFYGNWPMPDYREKGYEDYAEYNILEDISAAQIVCDEWPGEMIFSGFEIGLRCVSMKEYVAKAPADDPVKRAYELHPSGKNGRESWDHTAMLEAVRPGRYWYYHPWGQISTDSKGVTTWHAKENGKMTYLIPKAESAAVCRVIDDLVLPEC